MSESHVAAGLPPGHIESADCPCAPLISGDQHHTIVIHRIAPRLGVWGPVEEASHDASEDRSTIVEARPGEAPCGWCPHTYEAHLSRVPHRCTGVIRFAAGGGAYSQRACECPGYVRAYGAAATNQG